MNEEQRSTDPDVAAATLIKLCFFALWACLNICLLKKYKELEGVHLCLKLSKCILLVWSSYLHLHWLLIRRANLINWRLI